MKRRTPTLAGKLAAVCMLLALLLTNITVSSSAEGLRDVGSPGAGNEPDKIIRTGGAIPGIYHIDYLSDYYKLDPTVFPVDGAIGFWTWSSLNPAKGSYDWSNPATSKLDAWIKSRVDRSTSATGASIMISTYDATTASDILSTPNWVIKIPDAVIPATTQSGVEHYIDYYHRTSRKHLNGEFDNGLAEWTVSDPVAIVVAATPPTDSHTSSTPTMPDRPASGPALQLGGANNINATVVKESGDTLDIPAMPPSLNGKQNVYVTARVNIVTTDINPNDHLYFELWDRSGNKLGGTQLDINNLSHAGQPADYWKAYTFDVTSFATEKAVRAAFRVVTDGAAPTTFYIDNVQLRVRHLIPKYWGDAYKNEYKAFIAALGARYRTTPAGADPKYDLQFVAMGTGTYGESQPTQDVVDWEYKSTFDHVVKNAGLSTSEMWRTFVNEISLAHWTAFSTGDGTGPARHLFLQYAPSYMNGEERGYTTDYAAGLGIGLSHNRLTPEFTNLYTNDRSGFYDPIRLYWNSVPVAFEAYSDDLGCSPLLSYWAVRSAAEKHADYIRTDPTLLRNSSGNLTTHAPNFSWARDYLGKTVQNAPKVWTVMREHRNPAMLTCSTVYYNSAGSTARYPQYGNFNYWLYQVDTITGGKTVAETNDKGADNRYAYYQTKDASGNPIWVKTTDAGLGSCGEKAYSNIYLANPPTCNPEPYNANLPPIVGQNLADYRDFYSPSDWTGEGKEAYVVRRTDQATSNPYMFFRIDDGYIPGTQAYKASITVGYFDIGTDKWSLKYHSTTGEKTAGTVTKTGSKAYKEITFTVNDAKFANGLMGGSDFYLDSNPDKLPLNQELDEWIHKVEVQKLDSVLEPTKTPTVTPTPTHTATPTVTATATPNTGSVEGKAYHDLNGNNKLDAGEPGVAGAMLALLDAGSAEAYTTLSEADGMFRFPAVSPAQYSLVEKTPPPGFQHNTTYALTFFVNANQTLTGFNIGHRLTSTATPTPTATATATATPTATATATSTVTLTATPKMWATYLPLLLAETP